MAASNSNHRGTSGGGIQLGSAWFQRKINLRPQHRGVHLVTEEILRQMPELGQFSVGLCHVQSKNIFKLFSNFIGASTSFHTQQQHFMSFISHSFLIICNNAHFSMCIFYVYIFSYISFFTHTPINIIVVALFSFSATDCSTHLQSHRFPFLSSFSILTTCGVCVI